jgi:DNA-binding transcriptional MerR regulator
LPLKSVLFNKKAVNMALNPNKDVRLYYSIKEVAKEVGVNESTLRFWEKEFPHLRPKVTGNKVRQYTEKDIDQVKVIYNLIKVRGLKIAAARKYLNENRSGVNKQNEVLETLMSVREQLISLKKQLNGIV